MSEPRKRVPADGLLPRLNGVLSELFHAHGVETVRRGDWLAFEDHDYLANAQIVREIDNDQGLIVHLDVRLRLRKGVTLIDSVTGWGADVNAAVTSALNQFVASTFHVLLAAFFGKLDSDQATQKIEIIGGQQRQLTSGNVAHWGQPPEAAPGRLDMRWLAEFTRRLTTKQLSPGTHWVRLYYCHLRGETLECEVLLDSEPWTEFQTEMAGIDWPKTDEFYSVRWFLVVQEPP